MAGLLVLTVIAAVVTTIIAVPPPSPVPFRTFPSVVPYHVGGVLERIHNAAIKNFTIEPRNKNFTIQPRDRNFTIEPRKTNFIVQPRDSNFTIDPRKNNFTIEPRDTVVLQSRPLRYQPRATYELACDKKTQVAKIKPGDVVTFYSKNYPEKYSKKSMCKWKIQGKKKTTRISIDCGQDFNLQPSSKKGKCVDYLDIDRKKYCGTNSPIYSSKKNVVKLRFKSNKKQQYPGFFCTAVAYEDIPTTLPPTVTTTVEPTPAPTVPPTVAPTVAPTVLPSTCSCGRVNRATRIVGGVETEVNEYPWQVGLVSSYYSTSSFCGGSIINDLWILTAAHCAEIMSTSNYIVAGEHSWSTDSSDTQTIGIQQILVHPNYGNYMENDVALLKLDTALVFSDNLIAPVCPPNPTDLYESVDAIVTGWGSLSSGGSYPDSLQEVVVPTMTNSQCQNAYGSYITDDMICAGYDEGGKDACQGDSGGPLITADGSVYRQIGVVSWGYGCAYEGYPGVYSRVNSQLDWIKTSISGTSWCEPGSVVTSGPINTTPKPIVTTAPPSTNCSCGRVNRATRIVGGVETLVNEYPWMVGLAWSASSSISFCGGSIIHEKFVLTAAHCVEVMSGSEVVVIGEHDWTSSSESDVRETVTIAKLISNSNYNSQTYENDIALLKLSSPLNFGNDNKIAPICPPEAGNLYSDINALVTGWGTTSSGGSQSTSLLEVTVPTMTNSDCQSAYGSSITDDMICAGLPEGGKDACQGDSGGPMIAQDTASFYRQIGVVSWGYGCADPDYPGVYARVTSQLNWISSEMEGNNWCSSGEAPVTPAPTVAPPTPAPTEAPPTSAPGECSCGRVNRETRIVGGVETVVNGYPWMVGLAWSASSSISFCGGSILNEKFVLTAAHCAEVMDGSEVVVVGEHDWTSSSESDVRETVTISELISNPNYNSQTYENDVALLKLSSSLTFGSDNKIAPICPPEAGNLYSDINAVVTGWGTTSSGGSQSTSLLEVTVPTMTNSDCQTVYGSWITDDMICAGLPEGGKDACQGDSGGPMIAQDAASFYRQIGVVSWGSGCADPDYPGVYARVTSQLNWISSEMADYNWCSSGEVPVTPAPTEAPPTPTPGECTCGRVNRATRIVGGVETVVNGYPWMVGLAWSASSSISFCGGSIIHEKFVLTAAHCVEVMSGSEVVVVGEHNWSSSGESAVRDTVTIAEMFSHENYNSQTYENDVALLKLSNALTFGSDNKIAPICPPEASNLYSDINAIVTGWGTTSSGGSQSTVLLETTVPTMTNSDCQSAYGSSITDDMICAGLPEGGKDACQGDSGGPMIAEDSSTFYRQIGVVSWGYGCAYPDYPGVYARVTSQLDWISSKMTGYSWCSSGEAPGTPEPTVAPQTPAPGDCQCGRVNRETRIVNGQETEVLEYPWQAGIVSYSGSRTWCGGSLVNSKWVLTAAHCTDGTTPSQIQVLLGEHTIYTTDGTEKRFDVSQVINHPSYGNNPWANGHDVSLLKLDGEVDFSSTLIRPICLPTTQDLFAGAQATVTGFGRTGANDAQSLVLMEVDIPVVTNQDCANMYGSNYIDDTMICAGEGEGNGACMGDSGGPLITSVGDYHVQIGVVSFGSAYCDALGVYARVTELQTWIEQNTVTGNPTVCPP